MSGACLLHLDGHSLRDFYAAAFRAKAVPPEHADIAADGIYYSDYNGIDTHGVVNFLRIYLPKLESGAIDSSAYPKVTKSHAACATVDGRRALGFVVGRFAMLEALSRAREYGIGAVAASNSTHAGSMGYYTRQAAEAGMIGMAFTNLGAQQILCPPGGKRPILGTNVLAAAVPSASHPAFSLDMSTAVVSAGRIRLAARRGEDIPSGWLVDSDGRTVTDPAAYDKGQARLNFFGGGAETGGYKGFGLALLADMLCGALSGAAFGPHDPKGDQRSSSLEEDRDIGHFFLALSPGVFRALESFESAVDEILGTIVASTGSSATGKIMYPGLPEAETAHWRLDHGIPVDMRVAAALNETAYRLQICAPRTVG